MKAIERKRWVPGNAPNMWHFFLVTEVPLKSSRYIGSETRVAYHTFNEVGAVATSPEMWEDAKAKAPWHLAPSEVTAFDNLERREDGSVGPTAARLEALEA